MQGSFYLEPISFQKEERERVRERKKEGRQLRGKHELKREDLRAKWCPLPIRLLRSNLQCLRMGPYLDIRSLKKAIKLN